MKTERPIRRKSKRTVVVRSLGLSESVLKLFPKISRMGKAEPSQWGQATGCKPRLADQKNSPISSSSYC